MLNGPISASGLNCNPRNIHIYSSGYDPAPSLTSNHFSIFEIASIESQKPDFLSCFLCNAQHQDLVEQGPLSQIIQQEILKGDACIGEIVVYAVLTTKVLDVFQKVVNFFAVYFQ